VTAIEDVVDDHSGRSRTVLDYGLRMKRLVDEAKDPGFSRDRWDGLLDLVAPDGFERIGPFKDAMDWPQYVDFLDGWARSAEWECSFKRITEVDDRVYLELEERSRFGDLSSVVNSLSVYEFGPDDRIHHLDVYLQMEMPA